jgi:hypothetical protein
VSLRLLDLSPRVLRPWTEGDADNAGLATEVGAGAASAGAGAVWGSEMAGSMSETMRGGEPEDGDTIAEAEAEVELETGPGSLSWAGWLWVSSVTFVVFAVLVILSPLPCAVVFPYPVAESEGGSCIADGGSSTSAAAIVSAAAPATERLR